MNEIIQKSIKLLEDHCVKEGFQGYDPYDGLNSTLFQAIPVISKSRIGRLVWIQLFKKSPVNFRKPAGIKKEYNSKALGLFLSGYCNLYLKDPDPKYLEMINFLTEKIIDLANKNWSGICWGYNFDWQARAFFLPKYTPTVVATSFIGNALLDAYEITRDKTLLDTVRSSCDFISGDLYKTYDNEGNYAFSYSPFDNSVVFNASLLGSRLLSRVFSLTEERKLIEAAERSVVFCCNYQKPDGSWSYGTAAFHQWIDSFHTGYNLESVSDYIRYSGNVRYQENIIKGLAYYLNTFFTGQGIPKYYNNSVYPVDVHCPAQLIITLSRLGKLGEHKELAGKVLKWTIENMQSGKGFFYFQKRKTFTNKIAYMRWSQAWMFFALSEYLLKCNGQFNQFNT